MEANLGRRLRGFIGRLLLLFLVSDAVFIVPSIFRLYYSEMKSISFKLTTDTIELCQLLKAAQVTTSGGQAKWLIRDEVVHVNGQVETRSKRKIHRGDRVVIDQQISITCS